MDEMLARKLVKLADIYNDIKYFTEDPISFPRTFAQEMRSGRCGLKDVEVAAIFAAHFAWGRRSMIVRDCRRLFDHMQWRPYDYVMKGEWRSDDSSIHRTVKWRDVADICSRLRTLYESYDSLETLDNDSFRTAVYGQKSDLHAPDKKINMMRRWMVRNDGKVDLGLWKNSDPASLLIPLDVHVHDEALALGLTNRRQKDAATVREISSAFAEIFPSDPCKGDFALFGYGITGHDVPDQGNND